MKAKGIMLMLAVLFALGCGSSDWNPVATTGDGLDCPPKERVYSRDQVPPHCRGE